MIMGALRVNLPTILVSGGPMLAGYSEEKSLTYLICLKVLVL